MSYSTYIPGGSHWSLRVRRGTTMTLTSQHAETNVGMLFYNPENYLERYNAPDTLKCQHTFKLTRGNCLYSDMGRIFCSVIKDDFGWHDTVCGNTNAKMVSQRWGNRNYQKDSNEWLQNGNDSFLVEIAKYGLGRADMAANVNWFSKVIAGADGSLALDKESGKADASVTLRFEMDTLVALHTCPHPLNQSDTYPQHGVDIKLEVAEPVTDDDYCRNFRPENQRGFQNNALYHLGISKD